MVNECSDCRALIKTEVLTCVRVCLCVRTGRSRLKINILPVASDNDRAIFFGGWGRQSFWTGFRHKDKETNLDLWSVVWVGMIFVTFGSEIFQSTQDALKKERNIWRNTVPVSPTPKTKHASPVQAPAGLWENMYFWRSALCGKLRLTHHQQLHVPQVNIYMMKYKWLNIFVKQNVKRHLHFTDFMHFIALDSIV